MERLTCNFEGLNALRELCTPDIKNDGEYIDCVSCEGCCEDRYGKCARCPIQKAFDKLAAYEDAEEAAKKKRMIDVDIWIDKLSKIISDFDTTSEYVDYCMHLVSEIEAEFRAQELQAMKEGGAHD